MYSLLHLVLLVITFACQASGAPADSPIRVDLPVFDPPEPLEPLAGESVDNPEPYAPSVAVEAGGSVGASLLAQKGGIVSNIIAQKLHAATDAVTHKISNFGGQNAVVVPSPIHVQSGLFSAPVTKIDSAIQQTEGFESKPLSAKENLQNIVAGIFQPRPIVDTISEEDKYGNDGDKFFNVGRAVVGGAEGFSNLVNSALGVPSAIIKKITRTASEKLNNFGGKLIGLA